jgi:hypothetical protein
MDKIYKVITKAEDYPNGVRVCALKKGDCIYFVGNHDVKIGEKYKDHPAIVSRIDYKPKKWWQFWKKKEMIGYQVMWVGDEDEPSDDVNPRKHFENFMQKYMQGEVTIEL